MSIMPNPHAIEPCINALWDDEAKVWVATSDDVPLATEAPTFDALSHKLQVMVPELLELNGQSMPLTFELIARRQVTTLHSVSSAASSPR